MLGGTAFFPFSCVVVNGLQFPALSLHRLDGQNGLASHHPDFIACKWSCLHGKLSVPISFAPASDQLGP